MASKKQKPAVPAKQKPFSTTPFAALKGLVVEPAKPEKPAGAGSLPERQVPERSDDELFLRAMSGVQQLDPQPEERQRTQAHEVRTRRQTPPARPPQPGEERAASRTFLDEVTRLQLDVRFEDRLPDEEELRPLSGNRLRLLKRGIVRLDRQLDLHGLTREEALSALTPFLVSARAAGEQAVLVITGKGSHSAAGPVLQQVVAGWLRDQGRNLVAEFAPAPGAYGGSGAYVIFLRPLDKSIED